MLLTLSLSFPQSIIPPSLLICPHYEAACSIERMMSFNYVLFAKFIITECTLLRQMTYKNITKLLPFLFFATF